MPTPFASIPIVLCALVVLPCSVKSHRTHTLAKPQAALQVRQSEAEECSFDQSLKFVRGLTLNRRKGPCGDQCWGEHSSAGDAAADFLATVQVAWNYTWEGTQRAYMGNFSDSYSTKEWIHGMDRDTWKTNGKSKWKVVQKKVAELLVNSSRKVCLLDKCMGDCLAGPAVPCSGALESPPDLRHCKNWQSGNRPQEYHPSPREYHNDAIMRLLAMRSLVSIQPIGYLNRAGILSDEDVDEAVNKFDFDLIVTESVENCTVCTPPANPPTNPPPANPPRSASSQAVVSAVALMLAFAAVAPK